MKADAREETIPATVSQSEFETHRAIAQVDKQLFLELIKLSRFNVQFHLAANYHQPWRRLTYPVARESGTALGSAASIIDITQQASNFAHPRLISRNAIKAGIACTITGTAISGTASGLELAQNTWVMWKSKKKGYAPRASLAYVKEIVSRVDSLLAERERLTNNEPTPSARQVRTLETNLVRKIRQQLLYEFRTWSAHSRDRAWRENTFYTLDSMQSFTRMTSSIIARRALEEPGLAGSSIICAIVSNSTATLNPIFSNLVGMSVRKYQERKLDREFSLGGTIINDGMLAQELKELQENPQTELLTSAILLSERSEKIDVNLNRETREIDRYRQIAQQQSVSGPLIGLTGLASSIIAAVAFWGYREDPFTVTKLGFAGRIGALTGQTYANLNTPYTAISGMRRRNRLRRRGELPEQVLAERLKNLDRFEEQVNAIQPQEQGYLPLPP